MLCSYLEYMYMYLINITSNITFLATFIEERGRVSYQAVLVKQNISVVLLCRLKAFLLQQFRIIGSLQTN